MEPIADLSAASEVSCSRMVVAPRTCTPDHDSTMTWQSTEPLSEATSSAVKGDPSSTTRTGRFRSKPICRARGGEMGSVAA